MAYLFFVKEPCDVRDSESNLAPEYRCLMWRPSTASVVPPGCPLLPFGIWWLMHHSRLFSNRDYCLFLVYKDCQLVHRTCLFPRYFRFPFMARNDLQIGDTWTLESHRGRGIARQAIHQVVQTLQQSGRRFWYVTDEQNIASIHVVEKAGFVLAGTGRRSRRFGLQLFGAFLLEA